MAVAATARVAFRSDGGVVEETVAEAATGRAASVTPVPRRVMSGVVELALGWAAVTALALSSVEEAR